MMNLKLLIWYRIIESVLKHMKFENLYYKLIKAEGEFYEDNQRHNCSLLLLCKKSLSKTD